MLLAVAQTQQEGSDAGDGEGHTDALSRCIVCDVFFGWFRYVVLSWAGRSAVAGWMFCFQKSEVKTCYVRRRKCGVTQPRNRFERY